MTRLELDARSPRSPEEGGPGSGIWTVDGARGATAVRSGGADDGGVRSGRALSAGELPGSGVARAVTPGARGATDGSRGAASRRLGVTPAPPSFTRSSRVLEDDDSDFAGGADSPSGGATAVRCRSAGVRQTGTLTGATVSTSNARVVAPTVAPHSQRPRGVCQASRGRRHATSIATRFISCRGSGGGGWQPGQPASATHHGAVHDSP
jgi:hypothetical protein